MTAAKEHHVLQEFSTQEVHGTWEIKGVSCLSKVKNKVYTAVVLQDQDIKLTARLYPGGYNDPDPEASSPEGSVALCVVITSGSAKTIRLRVNSEIVGSRAASVKNLEISHGSTAAWFPEFDTTARFLAASNTDTLCIHFKLSFWTDPPAVATVRHLRPLQPVTGCESLAKDLEALLRDGIGSDATLRVGTDADETVFRVHRSVLAARSPVLREMLLSAGMAESADGVVKVPDVEAQIMRWFLHYLYTDEIAPNAASDCEALCHLLSTAHKYQVKSLQMRCETAVLATVTEDNACERLMMADMLDIPEFRQAVLRYIASSKERLGRIQSTEAYARLREQRPQLLGDILAETATPIKKRPALPMDLPENLTELTVAELKKLLSDRGLAVYGIKSVLVARLQASSPK